MFKFSDSRILSPSINGRQELVFRVKVKKEDYTLADFEQLCQQCDSFSFAVAIAAFQEETTDIVPKLRQELAMSVKSYAEKSGHTEDSEVQLIYKRNGVQSRSELTIDQLHNEIERYRLGMFEE